MAFRILSLDGGGVWAVIQVKALIKLYGDVTGRTVLQDFDLVAGTSGGSIVLGGAFTTLQPNGAAAPIPHPYIARLHADGTLDTSFDPKPNHWVYTLLSQTDGKVLLGGHFTAQG